MGNQQLNNLSNSEIQLLLSAYLGDGCFNKQIDSKNYRITFSSISKDLLEFKKSLLTNLSSTDIVEVDNNGYKKSSIFKFTINTNFLITTFYNLTFNEKLNLLDELGIALWLYDDGSLHKEKLFYNLNTHSFSYEENKMICKILFNFSINAKLTKEKKVSGKEYWYCRIGKYDGAFEISQILLKYPVKSLLYKVWSSTTIQRWSTLQMEWKQGSLYSFKQFYRKNINKI